MKVRFSRGSSKLARLCDPSPDRQKHLSAGGGRVIISTLSISIVCLVTMFAFALSAPAEAAPTVQLDTGRIVGAEEGRAFVFRGVPFAAPPVGPLRWRPPQPPASWAGVREATAYGPDCVQLPQTSVPGPGFINPVSEDCLYLNVWTPKVRPARPMPVMVWIYGGAYLQGAGSYPDYDGAHFAEDGVVLVNFNYRVGLFGFFAHPALTREAAGGPVGNYGLMDQIAALQWVQRNIKAFGGDPNNVTIFGQSAGASSVNAMLISPAARGLFAKAISESGHVRPVGGGGGWPSLAEAEMRGKKWASEVGVTGEDPSALRALATDKVLSGSPMPSPMIDGQIVPEPINRALESGRHAVVPYLVGANSEESSLLQWLPGALETYLRRLGDYRDQALRLYKNTDGKDSEAAALKLWGDDHVTAQARYLARQMSASGAPVYLYHYAYIPVAMRGKVDGAPHGAELNLVFGNEDRVPAFGEGGGDKKMADLLHQYWVSFAKTGNPNGDGRQNWPRYLSSGDELLAFTNSGAGTVKNFQKEEFDFLDDVYKAENSTH